MITNRLCILTGIFLFFLPVYLAAVEVQEKTNALIIGEAIKINSKILDEERPIWIYLPEDYKTSPTKKYPVLYMLDGAFHFHHITGAVQILAKRNRIPEMIVIAIPYLDYDRRDRDLSPTSVNGNPPIAGADNFLSFLKEELIPYTDKSYRTNSYRILFGHSRAGIFSINTLIENPEIFNSYITISPDLSWDDHLMLKKIEAFSIEQSNIERNLLLSVADGDGEDLKSATIDFVAILREKNPRGLNLFYNYMENENHGSIVHRAFYNNMEEIFSAWRLKPEQIETMSFVEMKEYYRNLSDVFGYDIQVPLRPALSLTQRLMIARQNKEAIDVANFILERDPNEAEAHFAIGYIHFSVGELNLAKEKFTIALQLSDKSDANYRLYRNYLAQAVKKIEGSKPEN